jgi:hypothetical protein
VGPEVPHHGGRLAPGLGQGHPPLLLPARLRKLIWLTLRNITADWGNAAQDWKSAMNQFAILYGERFTHAAYGGFR